MPTYDNGYVRQKNNHPISFDEQGNLTDQITGEKGTMMLPGFTVTGISPETRAKNYSTSFDGTYGLTPRDIYGMMPVVGDALDIKDIGTDLYNGDYINAGIGAGLFLLPNVVERPLKAAGRFLLNKGKKAYNTTKDLLWLTKTYNNVGTGLTNPYVRKKFLDLAKSPSTSRSFIEKYTPNKKEAGLNLSQIKEALPQLENLQEEFGIVPQANFKNYYTVSDQIGEIKNGLQYARNLSTRYNQELEFLKKNNEILYNIAKESPQYQQQIVNDLKNSNIGNIEDYVKNLIKQSNTFLRRMNLKSDQDFTDAFSTIRGRSLGHNEFAMDVGNAEVVFDPIGSRGYGNIVATYTPKELKLEGPVETWWSQRKPNFKDVSIQIEPNGMHTNRAISTINESITALQNANRYLQSMNIPNSYNRKASHMIFLSPNKGASISDQFTITPGYQKELKYTLGYKKGGKMNIIPKRQYNIGISIGINTYGFKNN